ncbi:hypothetical protein HOO65_040138 [Ceratocystis lukuohia]|uniref:PH domain-containing protein n=1 Tax=Ceratocystis lukuohia TaxID=2019550 RepID=A0ABR4MHR2_9PEZI
MALQTSPKRFIGVGGGGIVPQIDAPVTAINAGERRVTVSCGNSTISLPVTADTTPSDLLYSAANVMTQNINPNTSIITESYRQLFLERRLRRYEPVRDILNSWDFDAHNSLQIIPRDDTSSADWDLSFKAVQKSPQAPAGFCFQMYHSGRTAKWQKRYITLLETGQIFMSKKSGIKPSDKDAQTLCHLSDFEIFQPPLDVGPAAWKVLKIPKRFCYAVKSLQKQAVFPKGENFVHFFCTDDADIGRRFHDAIHAWRSWYLVNKMGVVDSVAPKVAVKSVSTITATTTTVKNPVDRVRTEVTRVGHHRMKVSVDETPYTIGAFEPLMDMSRFDKPLEEFGKEFLPTTITKPTRRETTKAPDSERYLHKTAGMARSTTVSHKNTTSSRKESKTAPNMPKNPMTSAPLQHRQKNQPSQHQSQAQTQPHPSKFIAKSLRSPTFPLVAAAGNMNAPPSSTNPVSAPVHPSQRKPTYHNIQNEVEPDFSSSGLLGSKYEQRKQEAAAAAASSVSAGRDMGNPFTAGPSLINSGIVLPSRSKSVRVTPTPVTSSGGFHSISQQIQSQPPPLPNAFTQDQERRSRGRTNTINSSSTTKSRSRSRGRGGSGSNSGHATNPASGSNFVRPMLEFNNGLPSARYDRPGHAVRAPAGVPLVDLAGGGGNSSLPGTVAAVKLPKSNSGGLIGGGSSSNSSSGMGLGRTNTVRSTGRTESRGRLGATSSHGQQQAYGQGLVNSYGRTETLGSSAAPRSRSATGAKARRAEAPPMPPLPHAVASHNDPYGRRFH